MERERLDCGEVAIFVTEEKSSRSLRPSIARFTRNHDGLGILRSNCNKPPSSPLLSSLVQCLSDQRGKREKTDEREGKKKTMVRGRDSRMGKEKGGYRRGKSVTGKIKQDTRFHNEN
ncbi:hypothetical protein TIFTF001_003717 [Ficus carica]|uniref:Uncharacterized protein n=1 Tax=Ficus carica TaxID=3494 RepID=A0AA88A1A7_FICCA|nr:hypothetical protein TIFTF001_003717 [Ficus carica]